MGASPNRVRLFPDLNFARHVVARAPTPAFRVDYGPFARSSIKLFSIRRWRRLRLLRLITGRSQVRILPRVCTRVAQGKSANTVVADSPASYSTTNSGLEPVRKAFMEIHIKNGTPQHGESLCKTC